ncbi:hypothetical protein Pmani_014228 [Petrolisthes manimaculis]|uniref:Uncharacterized protein n=1 Tax=Petrolisthes manimaculis TaxID=1843537 RepID=A0AAE1U8L5_9EUCA|nr:hypothetical protein Pmani_014228 [Petrolisthes manimaculis]
MSQQEFQQQTETNYGDFRNTTKGNVDILDLLLTHSQEEANAMIVLHALTVLKEAELVVNSPDLSTCIQTFQRLQRSSG